MSTFILKTDYLPNIRRARLDQILEAADEDEDVMLDSAETEAVGMVRKFLDTKYDMDVELAKAGAARHKVLLRMLKTLVIYYIYERVPDDMVPDRVKNNYKETMDMLKAIEAGDSSIPGLTTKMIANPNADGESIPKTKRMWGSQPKRSNDGGNPGYYDR